MKKSLLVLLLSLFHSCAIIDLQPDKLFSTTPSVEYEILNEEDSISICFSEDVDQPSVQSISCIRRNGIKAEITFDWVDGKKLIIDPNEELYRGLEYRLEFNGIYRNIYGTEREASLSLPFYLQCSEFTPLKIIDFYPADGAVLNSSRPVRISFNKAVDTASLSNALQINPQVKISKTWSADSENTLIIEAEDDWDNLKNYRITLDETLCSTDGDPLYPDWELSFYIEDGSSSPSVIQCGSCSRDRLSDFPWISENLENLLSSQAVRIRFSEAMDQEKTESSFSILPSTAGELYWIEEDLIFCPDLSFRSSQSFRLEITKDAESNNGIRMTDSYILDFNPAVAPIKLISLECSSPGGFILDEFSSTTFHDLPVQPVSPFDLSFHFTFSAPFTTDNEKQKVQDSLSFYEVFSSGGSPRKGLYSWSSDYRMTIISSGFTADSNSDYYYIMDLKGGTQGIFNSEGSYMDETVSQLFRTVRQ